MTDRVLVDKSALAPRNHHPGAAATLRELAEVGNLATSHLVALEVLYSARNVADYKALDAVLRSQPWLGLTPEVGDRALEVQGVLARRGQHRLSIPDLLIAATAEVHGATVLHHDRDFDRIGAVTGQPMRWIVAPLLPHVKTSGRASSLPHLKPPDAGSW